MALPMLESVLAQEHKANEVAELLESEKQLQVALKQVKTSIKQEAKTHNEWVRVNTLLLAQKKLQLRELQLNLAVKAKYNDKDLFAVNDQTARIERTDVGEVSREVSP